MSPRRLLAGVALLITIPVVAAGCDSSPFAASVNGQVVRQTALDAELRQFAGNSYYVRLAQQGVVTAPVTVAGTGTGSYTAKFAAATLTQMVIAATVRQHLAQTHALPGPGQYAATRAVDSVLYGPGAWGTFSPAFRSVLVAQDADLAMAETNGISLAQVKTAQVDYPTQLFSQVCVRTVAVDVNATDGRVDLPASLTRARAVAAAIEASPSTAAAGSLACYSAAELENEPLPFVLSVLDLRTGKAGAPQQTPAGYTVTAVTSRTLIPSNLALARAFTASINQNRGVTAQAVAALLRQARVKVNPAYGAWTGDPKGAFAVVPPQPPASGAAT